MYLGQNSDSRSFFEVKAILIFLFLEIKFLLFIHFEKF